MAFMFARNFPFDQGPCFARATGPGSCHASAQAFAGPAGSCSRGRRAAAFPFGNASAFESDMVDTPEAYLIYFDATGFGRGDVHVKVVDKTLKLSAKKGQAVDVQKAWGVPEDVLIDDITAKFSSSELTITLPRIPQEPKASFDVPIETGAQAVPPSSPAPQPVPEPEEAPMVQEGNDQEVDGSWVEVADEDVARAKEKDKSSNDGNVLEDADK